jgi:hypothetical protein
LEEKVAIEKIGFSKTNPSFPDLKRIDSKKPKELCKALSLAGCKISIKGNQRR